jgi:hypothetical protein
MMLNNLKFIFKTFKVSSRKVYKVVNQLLIMSIKTTIFVIIVTLITIDIILTNIFVKVFGATEKNPLCITFSIFMSIKIIISVIGLYILYKIKDTPCWIIFIIILTIIYCGLLWFNLNGIINYFF